MHLTALIFFERSGSAKALNSFQKQVSVVPALYIHDEMRQDSKIPEICSSQESLSLISTQIIIIMTTSKKNIRKHVTVVFRLCQMGSWFQRFVASTLEATLASVLFPSVSRKRKHFYFFKMTQNLSFCYYLRSEKLLHSKLRQRRESSELLNPASKNKTR